MQRTIKIIANVLLILWILLEIIACTCLSIELKREVRQVLEERQQTVVQKEILFSAQKSAKNEESEKLVEEFEMLEVVIEEEDNIITEASSKQLLSRDIVNSLSEEVIEEESTTTDETTTAPILRFANLSPVVVSEKENQKKYEVLSDETSEISDVPGEPMPEEYLEVIRMKSTAYCHCSKCCGKNPGDDGYGITHSGVNLLDGEVHKVIAADTNVLPFGTVVYIEGYGIATVEDTGSAIVENKVDIYFPDHYEAWCYGNPEIDVYVLSYPEN